MVYPNSPAFALVKKLRDTAIAILRFKKVNAYVEIWQKQSKDVTATLKEITKVEVAIERINQEDFSLTAGQVADGETMDSIKARRTQELTDKLEYLKNVLKNYNATLEETEKSIEDVRLGKYKFDRETITAKANELLDSGRFVFDESVFLVSQPNEGDASLDDQTEEKFQD